MGLRSRNLSRGRFLSAYSVGAASNFALSRLFKCGDVLRHDIVHPQSKQRSSICTSEPGLPFAFSRTLYPSSKAASLTCPPRRVSTWTSSGPSLPSDQVSAILNTRADSCAEEAHQIPKPESQRLSSSAGGTSMAELGSNFPGRLFFRSAISLNDFKQYSTQSVRDEGGAEMNGSFGATEIAARGWQITEESDSDWRGHAAAIARSIVLMKTRMDWTTLLSRLRQLDAELSKSDLWNNPTAASKLSRERGGLAGRVKAVQEMESELVEQIGMAELAREEKDLQVEAEAKEALGALRKVAKEKELAALLSGEQDECSCFLEVQAGAGGVESMDWAGMILRMYRMWAINRGYEVSTVEEMFGEEGGIKRGTIRVDGQFAYGFAKSEAGVHRLVRISPFDAGKRRHTSFAAVAVMPVLNESTIKIEIDEADLRIERYRAGGAGGQHVNKTESAVRIVHLPTGIVVQCQADRSQHRNKATALGVLQSRLYQMETARRAQAAAQHTETLGDITWGNQIRSYVLQPYQMVKDLRTSHEDSDPATVLDGDLDGFIFSYLASQVRDNGPAEGAK